MNRHRGEHFTTWRDKKAEAALLPKGAAPSLMLVLFLLLAFVLGLAARSATAQGEGTVVWGEPKLVHSTEGDILQPSEIVADSFGRVHIFWSESPHFAEGNRGRYYIYYSRRDAGRWTWPVDILTSSGGQDALMPKAAVDAADYFHMVWRSPTAVQYSSSAAATGESGNNWLRSEKFSTKKASELTSVIDAEEQLHVAYVVWEDGIYHQRYDVLSGVWSNPVLVSIPAATDSSPDTPLLAIGEDGTIHMLWTEVLADNGSPLAVFYSRSEDGGQSWSQGQFLHEGEFQAEDVALNGADIHVLLLGSANAGGRGHLWSADGGLTWSGYNEIVPTNQGAGRNQGGIVVDDNGRVFAAMGMYVNDYVGVASWDGSRWSEPQMVPGSNGDSIEDIHMTVGSGNRLHVMFVDSHKRLWYVEGVTQAPARPTRAAILANAGTLEAAAADETAPEPTATQLARPRFENTEEMPNSNTPILVGLLAAVCFVAIVVLVFRRR